MSVWTKTKGTVTGVTGATAAAELAAHARHMTETIPLHSVPIVHPPNIPLTGHIAVDVADFCAAIFGMCVVSYVSHSKGRKEGQQEAAPVPEQRRGRSSPAPSRGRPQRDARSLPAPSRASVSRSRRPIARGEEDDVDYGEIEDMLGRRGIR
jgi:hypothetical protein